MLQEELKGYIWVLRKIFLFITFLTVFVIVIKYRDIHMVNNGLLAQMAEQVQRLGNELEGNDMN